MDGGLILFYLFAATSAMYVMHFGMYLVGANFYDMWQFKRRHHLAAARRHSAHAEPLVSLLIPAHNEEKVILRCLQSIRAGSHQNLQIIVIDDASKDNTYNLVLEYKREHPDTDLSIVRRYKNVGKGQGLNYALQHRAKGKLVMTLDADSMLEHDTIKNAVSYFDDPSIVGVAANVRIIEEPTILGILQKFEHMIGYRSKKTYSLTKSEFVIGGVASTYRMEVLKEVGFYDTDTWTEDIGLSIKIISNMGNRNYKIIYAADVTALTEGVATFRGLLKQRFRWKYGSLQNVVKYRHLIFNLDKRFTRRLTWYRLPMAIIGEFAILCAPLLWGYVVYISLATHSLQLFAGAYLTITIYTLLTLWYDEHLPKLYCLRLSCYTPFLYFIFYLMDLIQFIAVVKCLMRTHRLVGQQDQKSTWVSPQRVGRQVVTG
ncbi:MAG TPA: glycosyltransferase [Candidatus Limnocylindria bacterium]|nr:glycosyltransferase [Candidatus Limnocylindria bacterium]